MTLIDELARALRGLLTAVESSVCEGSGQAQGVARDVLYRYAATKAEGAQAPVAYYYELNGSDTRQVIFEPYPSDEVQAWAALYGHKLHLLYTAPPSLPDSAQEPTK